MYPPRELVSGYYVRYSTKKCFQRPKDWTLTERRLSSLLLTSGPRELALPWPPTSSLLRPGGSGGRKLVGRPASGLTPPGSCCIIAADRPGGSEVGGKPAPGCGGPAPTPNAAAMPGGPRPAALAAMACMASCCDCICCCNKSRVH